MSRSIIFALSTLLFASATYGQELPKWTLPTEVKVYTTVEPDRVKQAVQSWQSLLPEGLKLTFTGLISSVQNCQGCVTVTRENVAQKRRGETVAYNYDGVSSYAVIRIDPRVKGDQFQRDLEHEIGHALGLPHYRDSIMQEKESKRHPASIDGDRLQAIYSLVRYSYRRVVTKGNLRRESVFTWNDKGEQIETQVVGSEIKDIPIFPIGLNARKTWATIDYLHAFAVVWDDLAPNTDLEFPVEAWKDDIRVVFSDYQLFRTSVSIRELPE